MLRQLCSQFIFDEDEVPHFTFIDEYEIFPSDREFVKNSSVALGYRFSVFSVHAVFNPSQLRDECRLGD